MFIKIHNATRIVVAASDYELIGKKFEDETRKLYLNESFFKGDRKDSGELKELFLFYLKEDACFNIVGKKCCNIAIESGLIRSEDLIWVEGIPFALILS